MAFPAEHRTQIASTNPFERLNREIKCRFWVAGIFPNKSTVTRLVSAILLKQSNEWARYLLLAADAKTCLPPTDGPSHNAA